MASVEQVVVTAASDPQRGSGTLVTFRPEHLCIVDVTTRDQASFEFRHSTWGGHTFRSTARPTDLDRSNRGLRSSIPRLCRNAASFLARSEDERLAALQAVAELGLALFEQMVPKGDRETFAEMLGSSPGVPLRACGAAASVPWEALCIDEKKLRKPTFLGMKHLVIRDTRSYRKPVSGSGVSSRAIGHVTDDGLSSVATDRAGSALTAFELPVETAPAIRSAEEERLLGEFLAEAIPARRAYHMDCHVEPGFGDSLPGSKLRITENHSVSYERLKSLLTIPARPFMFLNLCFGGSMDLGSDLSFARQFADGGAGEIITTEAALGDDFAAEFAETFYLAASRGRSVGEALLRTRIAFLEHDLNPAALFYSLYSQGNSVLGLGSLNDNGSFSGRWERAHARLATAERVVGGQGLGIAP